MFILQLIGLTSEFEPINAFAIILAYVLSLVIAISFHEYAHAYAAYKSGDNTAKAQGRLTLNPAKHISPSGMLMFLFFGFGWAKPVPINGMKFRNYKTNMALVSMAGIIVNVVLALLFGLISGWYDFALAGSFSNMFEYFLSYFFYFVAIFNMTLAVFNLLPIYPLDGFNFLSVFLKADSPFIQFMYKYGTIVLLLFILTPMFDIIFSLVMGLFSNIFTVIPALLW